MKPRRVGGSVTPSEKVTCVSVRESDGALGLASSCFGLSEQRELLAIYRRRRFAFFLSGAFCFANCHEELRLGSSQIPPTSRTAAFADRREIFSHFTGKRYSFGRQGKIIVNGLR